MGRKGIFSAQALTIFYQTSEIGKTTFRNGMTKKQVADAMRVDPSEITRALSGERAFTKPKFEHFLDLMGAADRERELCLEELDKDIFGLAAVERLRAAGYLPIFWDQYSYRQSMRKSGYPQQADNLAGPAITWIEMTLSGVKSPEHRKLLLEVLAWIITERGIAKKEYLKRVVSLPATIELLLRLDEIAHEVKEIGDEQLYSEMMGLIAFTLADMKYLLACDPGGISGGNGLYNLERMIAGKGNLDRSKVDLYLSTIAWHNSSQSFLANVPTISSLDLHAQTFDLQVESIRQRVIGYGAVGDLARLKREEGHIEKMMDSPRTLPDQRCALEGALARAYTQLGMARAASNRNDDCLDETGLSVADKAYAKLEHTHNMIVNAGPAVSFIRAIQFDITQMKWLLRFAPTERNELEKVGNNALRLSKEFGSLRYEDEIMELLS